MRPAAAATTPESPAKPYPASPLAAQFGQVPVSTWIVSQLPWLILALPFVVWRVDLGANFLYLFLAGVCANGVWRVAGIALSNNLSEEGAIIQWAKTVSIALVAGLVARFIFDPPGGLVHVWMPVRFGTFAAGVAVFYFTRQNIGYGILATMATVAALFYI